MPTKWTGKSIVEKFFRVLFLFFLKKKEKFIQSRRACVLRARKRIVYSIILFLLRNIFFLTKGLFLPGLLVHSSLRKTITLTDVIDFSQLECTNIPVPCSCKHEGQTIPIGTRVAKECNICECRANGQLECTQNPCSCQYQGLTYNIGQEFNVLSRPCTRCR